MGNVTKDAILGHSNLWNLSPFNAGYCFFISLLQCDLVASFSPTRTTVT